MIHSVYDLISAGSLLGIHEGIADALKIDDGIAEGKEKPYGVREFPDWKIEKDAIEKALSKRGIPFIPLIF